MLLQTSPYISDNPPRHEPERRDIAPTLHPAQRVSPQSPTGKINLDNSPTNNHRRYHVKNRHFPLPSMLVPCRFTSVSCRFYVGSMSVSPSFLIHFTTFPKP